MQALEAYEQDNGSGPLHAYAGSSPVAVCGKTISLLLPLSWPADAADIASVDVCPRCRAMVYGEGAAV